MEKFFLRSLLARDELDVVYQKNIHVPVRLSKLRHTVESQAVDKFVHELLRGKIAQPNLRISFHGVMPYSMHKVRFPQAYASIDEKRVVRARGLLCDGHGCCVGKLVAAPDNKCIEGVFGIEGGVIAYLWRRWRGCCRL